MIIEPNDLANHLNLETGTETGLLSDKIAAAEAFIEAHIGSPLSDFAVTTTVDEGYEGDPQQLTAYPAALKEAARQLAAHFYENREGQEMPAGVTDLLAPYRKWTF